jgi:hypothetical protein
MALLMVGRVKCSVWGINCFVPLIKTNKPTGFVLFVCFCMLVFLCLSEIMGNKNKICTCVVSWPFFAIDPL